MRFKHFLGECDSKEWISPKLVHGNLEYWIVLQIQNLEELTGDKVFLSSLHIVIPSRAPSDFHYDTEDEESRVGELYEYGYKARVSHKSGENPLELMYNAVDEARLVPMFFGNKMMMRQNMLGDTGWDWVSGQIGCRLQ